MADCEDKKLESKAVKAETSKEAEEESQPKPNGDLKAYIPALKMTVKLKRVKIPEDSAKPPNKIMRFSVSSIQSHNN